VARREGTVAAQRRVVRRSSRRRIVEQVRSRKGERLALTESVVETGELASKWDISFSRGRRVALVADDYAPTVSREQECVDEGG
jgi:hypothetical protein